VQNRRLGEPRSHDLHVDWQPFLARAKPYRQPRQASDIERHSRVLEVSGVHFLRIDDEFRDAMLMGRDRQYRCD